MDEIGAVEAAVERMARNLAVGFSALSYAAVDKTLLGATLGTTPFGFNDVCLDVAAIRACYYSDSRTIALEGETWHTGQTLDAVKLDAFRTWVTAALAHEACHLLQHRQEPHRFGPKSEAGEADALSRKAKSTGLPADYVAYVSCALEIEAHATQLAAELRPAGQLSYDAFFAAAKASDLVAHVKRKSTSSDGDPWPAWDLLETTLIDGAWAASEMMWGR
ncbi:hypothetical protein VH567_11325 [Sphingomonas sp. 4RDLI-65]|uniref:hypothetical protein n=1 Tax=Sphingomonas sp. 4RDLI-65 TaxID=3111641 RepID=UPI003C17641D